MPSWLQWGRDLLVAEVTLICAWLYSGSWLQWGRDLLVAEVAPASVNQERVNRFNGAATCWSRKWPTLLPVGAGADTKLFSSDRLSVELHGTPTPGSDPHRTK